MLRSRLLWKLFAGYVAVITMTALAVSILQWRTLGADAREATVDRLGEHAELLRELALPTLERGGADPELEQRLQRLGRNTSTRFTVLDASEKVLADSHEDPATMANHHDRPGVHAARESQQAATAERYSATRTENMVYLALAVRADDRLLGFVCTARPSADVSEHLARLRGDTALAVLIVTVVACALSLLPARRLTGRLRSVTASAEAMAAGYLDRRVEPMGADEIGKLGRAFNAMADQLASRIHMVAKERAELLAILRNMDEGVVVVDLAQRVMLINGEARRILGIDDAAIEGHPIWEVTRIPAVSRTLDLVARGAPDVRDEITLPRRGGGEHVEMRATQLRDDQNAVTGAIVVLHDISELRRLETVRRDFVTNVSHELKTPLTSIRGFVETLLDDENADADTRRRFLGKIRDHSHRLSALVTDLLTLARVESNESRPERALLDLREPVRCSAELLIPRAESKDLSVNLSLPDRAITVTGDAELLRQVVDNLLDNAIKYTPAGGSVDVRVRSEGEAAVLEVQDTGVGLEPRHQQRVFERFYRVDRGRSRELGGTGLGLSIVKHIVLSHQGSVSVQSTPGEGSTFRVQLPLAPT